MGAAGGDMPLVKIGSTSAGVGRRLKQIQDGQPYTLELLAVVASGDRLTRERELQKRFDDLRVASNREWYRYVDPLRSFVEAQLCPLDGLGKQPSRHFCDGVLGHLRMYHAMWTIEDDHTSLLLFAGMVSHLVDYGMLPDAVDRDGVEHYARLGAHASHWECPPITAEEIRHALKLWEDFGSTKPDMVRAVQESLYAATLMRTTDVVRHDGVRRARATFGRRSIPDCVDWDNATYCWLE
jgi:hypothetical protein